jgi:hypothetical protein
VLFANFHTSVGLCICLFQIQIYYYKVNHNIDITLHQVTSYILLFNEKIMTVNHLLTKCVINILIAGVTEQMYAKCNSITLFCLLL